MQPYHHKPERGKNEGRTYESKQHVPMIVMFANTIGKNTADFDARDMAAFLNYLWRVEPYKNELCKLSKTKQAWSKHAKVNVNGKFAG